MLLPLLLSMLLSRAAGGECGLDPGGYYPKDCPKNEFHQDGSKNCKACPQGFWRPKLQPKEKGGDACTPFCFACRPGKGAKRGTKYTSEIKACTDCYAGQYSPGGSNACKFCARGYYQNENIQSFCKACKSGTYNSEEGSASDKGSSCKKCPQGKYQPALAAPDATHCVNCIEGRYGESGGASLVSHCHLCKNLNGSSDDPLSSRYYQDVQGAQVCKLCKEGQASNRFGTGCLPCKSFMSMIHDVSSFFYYFLFIYFNTEPELTFYYNFIL